MAADENDIFAAKWSQWRDLANRVKSAGKIDITVTSVDPGEGSTLAEGKFIGVYGDAELVQTADIANTAITTADIANTAITTAKIANGAVTSDKINFSTLTGTIPEGTTTVSLTVGKWLVFAFITVIAPATGATPGFYFLLNGSRISETCCGNSNRAIWENLVLIDSITIASGDVFQIKADSSNDYAYRSKYVAIRIG